MEVEVAVFKPETITGLNLRSMPVKEVLSFENPARDKIKLLTK